MNGTSYEWDIEHKSLIISCELTGGFRCCGVFGVFLGLEDFLCTHSHKLSFFHTYCLTF